LIVGPVLCCKNIDSKEVKWIALRENTKMDHNFGFIALL